MKKIILIITLFIISNFSYANNISFLNNIGIENKSINFMNEVNLEGWKVKLDELNKNNYEDMCGEKGKVPRSGFNLYCEFYYSYSYAKEKSFKDNIAVKYKNISSSLYDISNQENELFNNFYLNYDEDKIVGNDINKYVEECDNYYKDKYRSNQCVLSLSMKSKNPFNIGLAYCYYKDSKIDYIDKHGKYWYRKTDLELGDKCFSQYISQNKDYFLKWELYIGYKTGMSLSTYINENNIYDFILKNEK